MVSSDEAESRLADVRELQPTTNSELAERWGMSSGKEVAQYLQKELGEHTYRDDDSKICAVDAPDTADPDAGGEKTAHSTASRDSTEQEDVSPSPDERDPETPATDGPADPSGDVSGSASSGTRTVSPGEDNDAPNAAGGGKNPLVTGPSNETADDSPETESGEGAVDASSDVAGTADGADSAATTNSTPPEVERGCPNCGADLIDARGVGSLETADGNRVPAPDEFYCSGCGHGFNHSKTTQSDTSGGSGGSGWLGTVVVVGATLAAAAGVLAKAVGKGDGEDEIPTY